MNLKKFRHKKPRNKGYINLDVVRADFNKFTRELPVYKKKKFNLDTIEAALVLKYNLSK